CPTPDSRTSGPIPEHLRLKSLPGVFRASCKCVNDEHRSHSRGVTDERRAPGTPPHGGGVVSRGYKIVMGGCAFVSGAVALAYIAVATISLGDGVGTGIEIPREANILSAVIVMLSGTIAADAWLTAWALRQATRTVRPIIRVEVERGMTGVAPELASVI